MNELVHLIEKFVLEWVGALEVAGYWGIFVLMTIESSFIPFPSEIVMLPAGILAVEGKLNLWGCIAAGTGGSIAGALVNYYLAIYLGRAFIMRYGRYFFLPPDKMEWVEGYWGKHGEMTTFVCRLLPAIRQLISIPAGLARMNLARFVLFTGLGAGSWVVILTLSGYFLGPKALELWEQHKLMITVGLCLTAVALIGAYVLRLWLRRPAVAGQNSADAAGTVLAAADAERVTPPVVVESSAAGRT